MTQTTSNDNVLSLRDRAPEHVDVLIVGAGISGIGTAFHIQDKLPHKSYAILEMRDAMGGTWDLFRYPGIRSDSDMHTLGFRFRPWTAAKSIADGPSILEYVHETAREYGIDEKIRYHHKVVGAAWSTDEARWTVSVERTDTGEEVELTCDFLMSCSGYYRYDQGYTPEFPGAERFEGTVIHPQHWPEDLDYTGKRVVVIGSGATAVTLVPAMTDEAEHVTMLQRSPTYILPVPGEDPVHQALRKRVNPKTTYGIVRWKNVLMQSLFYRASRRWPDRVRKLIRAVTIKQLPEGYEVDKHFKPAYNPWDQRVCIVPDADLFRAIRSGKASIATDTIETFTEKGIRLSSGEELEADIVVTATGLNLEVFGGVDMVVDGERVDMPSHMAYKAIMLSDVPNFAFAIGYTNASWTLKVDLTAEYVCRLLRHMERDGKRIALPHNDDPSVTEEPLIDFQAGYVLRSLHKFPKNGSKSPWKLDQNYPADLVKLRFGRVDDAGMTFTNPPARRAAETIEREAVAV
jgi:cation diffusion facilitator CzcD-associated flavoprotein CzcO